MPSGELETNKIHFSSISTHIIVFVGFCVATSIRGISYGLLGSHGSNTYIELGANTRFEFT